MSLLISLALTLSAAAAEGIVTATDPIKAWSAELGAELSTSTSRPETGRSYAYVLSGGPSYELGSGWSLSAKTEAEFIRGAENNGNKMWKDSSIYMSKSGYELGNARIAFKGGVVLPTARSERDAGLFAAPAAGLSAKANPLPKLAVAYSLAGTRYLRNSAQASALDGARWKAKQEISVVYEFLRNISLGLGAAHEIVWKWTSRHIEKTELSQALGYEFGIYSFAIGHKAETKIRAQDGTRESIALFRAPESTLFANMTVNL